MKNKEGWDGKLRVEPKAVITNPEALEDSDYSDPDAPPVEEIDADEGKDSWGSASTAGYSSLMA
jgi:protein phosphatase 1 regulatory subunit 7